MNKSSRDKSPIQNFKRKNFLNKSSKEKSPKQIFR